MSEKQIVYIVVAIVVAHFIFAAAYLLYKVYSAPKTKEENHDDEE